MISLQKVWPTPVTADQAITVSSNEPSYTLPLPFNAIQEQWDCTSDTKVEKYGPSMYVMLIPLRIFLQPVITIRTARDSGGNWIRRTSDQVDRIYH
jgi:hypothetical protein